MKISHYIIFSFVLLASSITDIHAQNETRSFFSVSGGYSLPVGELAKKKLDDPFAGLTGSGYYGQVNYDFRFARWLGVKVSGSMNQNKTRPQPIIDRANVKVEEIRQIINETSAYSWQTNVSKWKFNSALIGPALYLNFNRVQFEAHVQGGYVHVTSPTVRMTGTFESGENTIGVNLAPATSNGFGGGVGGSLRIPIFNKLYFQLTGDFIATEAEFKDVVIKVGVGNYPEAQIPLSEKRFVGVANIGAGFGLAF